MRALGFVWLALDIWAVHDIMRRRVDAGSKLTWMALVLLLPFAGLVVCLIVGRGYLARLERTGQPGF